MVNGSGRQIRRDRVWIVVVTAGWWLGRRPGGAALAPSRRPPQWDMPDPGAAQPRPRQSGTEPNQLLRSCRRARPAAPPARKVEIRRSGAIIQSFLHTRPHTMPGTQHAARTVRQNRLPRGSPRTGPANRRHPINNTRARALIYDSGGRDTSDPFTGRQVTTGRRVCGLASGTGPRSCLRVGAGTPQRTRCARRLGRPSGRSERQRCRSRQ